MANAKLFNMRYDVLRRRVRQLQQLDWAYEFPHPETRRPVIVPFMPLAVEQMVADELQRVRSDTPHWGEWILDRWLGVIVDDDNYVENTRPESLVSGFGRDGCCRSFHRAKIGRCSGLYPTCPTATSTTCVGR